MPAGSDTPRPTSHRDLDAASPRPRGLRNAASSPHAPEGSLKIGLPIAETTGVETARACRKPVAIVALGNPAMGDDGVALRVMGRVRPLLGEIALTGRGADSLSRRGGLAQPVRRTSTSLAQETSPHSLVALVDWIEGLCPDEMLRPVLEGRQRVVLIDAVAHDASPGHVHHWHISHRQKSGLHAVYYYQAETEDTLDHLPFWLEEEMPPHGTDLIAIEPYRIESGSELSTVLRSRLAGITAQVGGLLLRILEEEGWRFGRPADPVKRPRRGRVA